MNQPTRAGELSGDHLPEPRPDPAPARSRPLLRRYEAICLDASGAEVEINQLAPATDFFESAFNAVARGTLIATPSGPVAIEDLRPGDPVDTAEGGAVPVLWRGNLTLYPLRPGGAGRPDRLYRVTADALGYGRPMQDLLLGPGARVWSARSGGFVTPEMLVDGDSVVELTPPTAVAAYHLCLESGCTLLANGMAFRSYMPDPGDAAQLPPEMLELFLSLFPNAAMLEDFRALPEPHRGHAPYARRIAVA